MKIPYYTINLDAAGNVCETARRHARQRERERKCLIMIVCSLGSNVKSKFASLIQNLAKFNIDTKNDGLENMFPFKLW